MRTCPALEAVVLALQGEIEALTLKQGEAEASLQKEAARAADAEARVSEARAESERRKAEYAQELEFTKGEVVVAREALEAVTATKAELEAELVTLQGVCRGLEAQVAQQGEEMEASQGEIFSLKAQKRELEAELQAAAAHGGSLEFEVGSLRGTCERLQGEVEGVRALFEAKEEECACPGPGAQEHEGERGSAECEGG